MVGILDSFWDGQISGAMLVSGRVQTSDWHNWPMFFSCLRYMSPKKSQASEISLNHSRQLSPWSTCCATRKSKKGQRNQQSLRDDDDNDDGEEEEEEEEEENSDDEEKT